MTIISIPIAVSLRPFLLDVKGPLPVKVGMLVIIDELALHCVVAPRHHSRGRVLLWSGVHTALRLGAIAAYHPLVSFNCGRGTRRRQGSGKAYESTL